MKKLILAASAALFIFSCGGGNNATAPAADSSQVAPAQSDSTAQAEVYGTAITEDGAIAMADLTKAMEGKTELQTKITGEIDAVCQKKGCWMDIKNPAGESVRVTFKDYGFFMPKDAAGRTAIMEGVARVEETSVADLQEYARDAGKSDEEVKAIKEPKKELVFEASGVILK